MKQGGAGGGGLRVDGKWFEPFGVALYGREAEREGGLEGDGAGGNGAHRVFAICGLSFWGPKWLTLEISKNLWN